MQDQGRWGFISPFACKPLGGFMLPFQSLLEDFFVLTGDDAVPNLGSFESENIFRITLLF